jgi:hypothetical protein
MAGAVIAAGGAACGEFKGTSGDGATMDRPGAGTASGGSMAGTGGDTAGVTGTGGGPGTGGGATAGAGGRGTGGFTIGGAGGRGTGGAATGVGGTGGIMCSAGTHRCGSECKGDTDPNYCGAACAACSGATPQCVGGTCGCSLTTCGGACVDTMTDAAHCGRCAHSCTGGTCLAGKCQPVVIAANQYDSFGIALDATYVYFTVRDVSNGPWFVRRAPLAGNAQQTAETLVSGLDNVSGLAVNATHIYVTNLGTTQNIVRAPIGGGAATVFANGEDGPGHIRVQGTNAYWARGADPIGQIMRQALSGAPGSATSISGPLASPTALSIDTTTAYFALSSGSIYRVPLAGGTTTLLSSGQTQMHPFDIAADATHVYWSNNGLPSGIMRVPIGGGTATPLYSNTTSYVSGIAIDATYIYFGMGQEVLRMPLAGGTPETIAANQGLPFMIAVNATHVYWTSRASRSVARVAK